jgi:hypothetical protein
VIQGNGFATKSERHAIDDSLAFVERPHVEPVKYCTNAIVLSLTVDKFATEKRSQERQFRIHGHVSAFTKDDVSPCYALLQRNSAELRVNSPRSSSTNNQKGHP